jgi:sialic acid synthase SpsE
MTRLYIVAEIASAHEGDPGLARRLFDLAAATGADAVKFQIFRRSALISRAHAKYDSFGEIELSEAAWRDLLGHAAAAAVDTVIEVYDEPSLALAESAGEVAAYKIPTSDIANPALLKSVAATDKPIQLAVGGATDEEIDAAVALLRSTSQAPLTLTHGFQSYPTAVADARLARLETLRRRHGLAVGFADHTDAEAAELARLVPAMAVAAGATVIEKHFTDDRSRRGRDHYSALNPDEFANFVALMREVAAAIGDAADTPSPAELTYRDQMKRHAVAARDLAEGKALAAGDIVFKRTGRTGVSPLGLPSLLRRRLRQAVAADTPILEDDLA